MESYRIEHLTFSYPSRKTPALNDINICIEKGRFVTLCGKSGCGKSTLLRHLKTVLTPHGTRCGKIFFEGICLSDTDMETQTKKIGFVMQSPDNQIVTDKVWHELAFGLESLGYKTNEIRERVAETASFFGIQTWFHKNVTELSGGQKQLMNLAAVMAMQPSVLILDEPTSQLDPIAASDFLAALSKINRELGTTVILTEHRLEEALPLSDRVIVMENGYISADGSPSAVGAKLKLLENDMFEAFPTPIRVYSGVENDFPCPVTVREGRQWLNNMTDKVQVKNVHIAHREYSHSDTPAAELTDIWFRYEKSEPDIIKGLSVKIYNGELYAIVGGNGTGKTTALGIISGLLSPYRGKILINGRRLSDIHDKYNGLLGVLPQNPQTVFVKKTVELDLYEILSDRRMSKDEKAQKIADTAHLCELDDLLSMHPYDLSGGEMQRAALAKVLLSEPRILILDEPTKGMDAHFKIVLADIFNRLKQKGVAIIMVSHDIEFCAEYADKCGLFFDGTIIGESTPREFFSGKNFYTTAANRMSRGIIPNAVLSDDIILALGGKTEKKEIQRVPQKKLPEKKSELNTEPKITIQNIVLGCVFSILFLAAVILSAGKSTGIRGYLISLGEILSLGLALFNFTPQKTLGSVDYTLQTPRDKRRLSKRTAAATLIILFAIPLTIYIGVYFLGDKKYYFISLLIILETLIPFAMVFEDRKPQARELVVISVLCAAATAGRAAFFMLPQFKPVLSVVIISGICFGGETGFLVGAITGFVSNMFFVQGPWTPWQMFSLGIVGFIAGILFQKGFLRKTKGSLCIYGALAAFVIYGGIMDAASVIIQQPNPTAAFFYAAYISGIPFNLIHAASTVFFLWFLAEPMTEKAERIKIKYGLME